MFDDAGGVSESVAFTTHENDPFAVGLPEMSRSTR